MTILDKILIEKAKEVEKLKEKTYDTASTYTGQTFRERIRSSHMNIISEIKRSSPSKGEIQMDVNPIEQAKTYEAHGATAISVLTDEPFFNGSMEDLRAVREVVNIPILCKDFMIHPVQIDRAKEAGANIILLIVAALQHNKLFHLYEYAKSLDLEVLVEVHNEDEMERALDLGADIIGINNRDLKTFEVDLETTDYLASMVIDPETIVISESGIRTKEDVETVAKAGANVILVGETFMRSNNLQATFEELQIPLKNTED
ncbi:indole-3-glycerol phosphate synthase TrpC [Ornithinibacillus sp. 4-3]|uniref:Indole-3-glycerol phosphate synthase n=1 Tax=Ornithinibacillus sp. 4-3 TaxID=3231488 RepID=A0AB39HRC1_9BACI